MILSIISAVVPIISANVIINLTGKLWNQLIIVSLIVLLIELARNLSGFFAMKMSSIFFRETRLAVQMAISKRTVQLETKVIDGHSSGVFIDRLNRDSSDIANIRC